MLKKILNLTHNLYSLDRSSMAARSALLHPAQQSTPINYQFNLFLHPGDRYEGVAQIAFNLHKVADLFLDFQGRELKQMVVNGVEVNPSFEKGRISLKGDLLKQGSNNVCVSYENQYDKDGSGCVSFTDVDGKQYLYTQF